MPLAQLEAWSFGESGIRFDRPYCLLLSLGADVTALQVQINTVDTSGAWPPDPATCLYDSGLREPDGATIGLQWAEIWIGLDQPGMRSWAGVVDCYVTARYRGTGGAISAGLAQTVNLILEAAVVSNAQARGAV